MKWSDRMFGILAFVIVYPLRAVAPVMFICVLLWPFLRWPFFVGIYAVLEVIFYMWFRRALQLAQKRHPAPENSLERRLHVWQRIRDDRLKGEDAFGFMRGWFHPLALHDVKRQDMKRWMAWSAFDSEIDELSIESVDTIEELLDDVESHTNTVFSDGPAMASVIRLNLDYVHALHRPLVYYVATAAMDLSSDLIIYSLYGFRRHRIGPVTYWFRERGATGNSITKRPVVFVHGVGMGLVTYLPFIASMATSAELSPHPLILLELPHVSMKLGVEDIPAMAELVDTLEFALHSHGFDSALFVAHSLGTFIVAAVNRLKPELVTSVVLVDPVCFLLWEADLVRNFCYRTPSTPMQNIQHYHISRELSISHYFHRHFFWHECVLFAQDLPALSTVFVSALDDIYNVSRVSQYLAERRIPVHTFSGMGHGGWILNAKTRSAILHAISATLVNTSDWSRLALHET